MGYTTDFSGVIEIKPPLNQEEMDFLTKFAQTRRMDREAGPYYAEPGGDYGQSSAGGVRDHNRPPPGQPGLWCQWIPTTDGGGLTWDGGEKFYDSAEWMTYLIDHFLKPGCKAKKVLPFLQANHICNGTIKAQGEDMDDRWKLVVKNNKVSTKPLE